MNALSAMKEGSSPRTSSAHRLRFGECEIETQTRELWRQGQLQKIRRKAFDLLLLLIDQRPQTLSHERIASAIWGSKSIPPQHVARAVMEARREIGDDPDSPRYILSVRGVGYRFAAEVTYAVVGATSEPDGAEAGALVARADIDAAASCMRRADYEEARRLVDRAIATADLAGARPELAHALALAATVMLRVGSNAHAVTLATKAMRMAQIEGRSDVLAQAHLGLAEVQLWAGSAHAALDHLQAAHAVLVAQGPSDELRRCKRVLSDVYRQIGRPEDALQWCEGAEALALQLEPETHAIHERLLKVAILDSWSNLAGADGREDEARALRQRALELLDVIEPDARAIGSKSFETTCLAYRAYMLQSLDRSEEAWVATERLRPILFGDHVQPTPLLELRRNEFHQAEAALLSRSGRASEAIQSIEKCIALASKLSPWSKVLADAQSLAAKICERAGRYEDALAWTRRQLRTTIRLHTDRAQATADIVRAQLESDRLGEDLAQARAEVESLRQLNQELERRIVQMDRHPLLDEGGLVPAAALAATIDGRAALARERELPLCIGIVEAVLEADEDASGSGLALKRRLKLLSSTLKAVIPEASAPAQWRPGVYVFIIPDMGLGPARQRCQLLAHRMNVDRVPSMTPDATSSFRADAVDVTRFSCADVALEQLPDLNLQAEKVG